MPTVLPTVGHRGPRPGVFLGALRPTLGNTVGITTPFSVHGPVHVPPQHVHYEEATVLNSGERGYPPVAMRISLRNLTRCAVSMCTSVGTLLALVMWRKGVADQSSSTSNSSTKDFPEPYTLSWGLPVNRYPITYALFRIPYVSTSIPHFLFHIHQPQNPSIYSMDLTPGPHTSFSSCPPPSGSSATGPASPQPSTPSPIPGTHGPDPQCFFCRQIRGEGHAI